MLFLTRSATILLGRCSFENFNFSDTYVFAYIYFPSLENIILQGLGGHKDFISYEVDVGHLQTCGFNNTRT